MSAEVPWWTRTTTAAVRITHKRCGGTIGTAAPLDAGGLTVIVREYADQDTLDEMRRAAEGRIPRRGERHLIRATEQHRYRTAATMPATFDAWCVGCQMTRTVEAERIAAKVEEVRATGEDRTLGA
jgi:hypothetical protein